MVKLTVDLKEFQNKAMHVVALESAIKVKDKKLNNPRSLHDKFKEKLKESKCKLRVNTKINCEAKWEIVEKNRKNWNISKRSWAKEYIKRKRERNQSIEFWKLTST